MKPAVDLSPYRYSPTTSEKIADKITGLGKSILPKVSTALGAGNVLFQGYDTLDAANKLDKDSSPLDYLRTGTKGLSTVGAGLSMMPGMQGVGLAMQAPEFAWSTGETAVDAAKELNKRRQAATKEDTDRMLMNVDPMGNPL